MEEFSYPRSQNGLFHESVEVAILTLEGGGEMAQVLERLRVVQAGGVGDHGTSNGKSK